MTKAELIEAMADYPDDAVVLAEDANGDLQDALVFFYDDDNEITIIADVY